MSPPSIGTTGTNTSRNAWQAAAPEASVQTKRERQWFIGHPFNPDAVRLSAKALECGNLEEIFANCQGHNDMESISIAPMLGVDSFWFSVTIRPVDG
jgi:hypothetical protein